MTRPKVLKIGIIGTSRRTYSLLPCYKMMEGCRITALCDKINPRVQKAYDMMGDDSIVCYEDHREMLQKSDVDVVFVDVAPEDNAALVCEALEAGKHVMCEVPLAFTVEDCWKVVLAVEKSGLKFQMNEQTRYWPFIQAWRKMVAEDTLGKILFVEGQYLHGMNDYRYWYDAETGEGIDYREAQGNPNARKSRIWNMRHPILYLPHELSPILSVIDDRVKTVSCMGTRSNSYRHEWLPQPDLEVALMHTEKDVVLRLAASFTAPTNKVKITGNHWYHFMGTKGKVETHRSNTDKMKLWLPEFMNDPAETMWEYNSDYTFPAAAVNSGHAGADFWPIYNFVNCILEDKDSPMDVYKAVEATVPAIIASKSAEAGGQSMEVPDFRPNAKRKLGQKPNK